MAAWKRACGCRAIARSQATVRTRHDDAGGALDARVRRPLHAMLRAIKGIERRMG
jgi:hypothetical protein